MKITLLACSLVIGFMLPLQAYKVRNRLNVKKVVLSNFVYYLGSDPFPQPGTATIDPGESWAEAICEGVMTASFSAKVGLGAGADTFQINGINCSDVIIFFNDNGTIKYKINSND